MVKKAKDIEVIEESSSDEEITMPKHSKQPKEIDTIVEPKPAKPGKEKKPYVLTPARKAQFEKARLIREDNIARNNAIRDEKAEKHEIVKNELLRKKEIKSNKKKERDLKQLIQSDTESSEEEVIV